MLKHTKTAGAREQDTGGRGDAHTVCSWRHSFVSLAEVELEVDGRRIAVEAAVSDTLPMPLILGTDVAELKNLLGSHRKDEALWL